MAERNTILIVDDMKTNRMILRRMFEDQYKILEAKNGKDALGKLDGNTQSIAVILLDVVMPVMDGLQMMDEMQKRGSYKAVPVILITADNSSESELRAHDLGVADVIMKPFNPIVVKRRVENIIQLYRQNLLLQETVQRQTLRLSQTNDYMIEALSSVIEYRNMESGQHIRRIRALTRTLLEYISDHYPDYRMSQETIALITSASAMHDIGKIAVPDSVLLKPGALTPEEFKIMKTHTTKGCEVLEAFRQMEDREYLHYCYLICRYHHERWDGNGYPEGLRGDGIPLCAQVVSVADVYDALTSNRVYKPAIPHEKAVQMILDGQCGVFSPMLMDCFQHVKGKFGELAGAYSDQDSGGMETMMLTQRDILEELRQTGQEQLPEDITQAKFQTALTYIGETMIEADLDTGAFQVVFSAGDDIFTKLPHDYGESFQLFTNTYVHPNDREALLRIGMPANILAAFQGGDKRITCSFRKYDEGTGTYKWYECTVLRVDAGSMKRHSILVFLRDTDDQRMRQIQKSASGQGYRYAVEDLYKEIYLNNLTTDVCRRIQNFDSISADPDDAARVQKAGCYSERTAYHVEHDIHPEDRERYIRCFSLASLRAAFEKGEKEINCEARWLENGEYHWYRTSVVKMDCEGVEDQLCLAFVRDINQFRRLQDRLAHTEERLRTSLQTAYDQVMEVNLDTGVYEILKLGDIGRTGTYPKRGDYCALSYDAQRSWIHPDDREKFAGTQFLEALKTAVFNGARNATEEYRMKDGAGAYRWTSVTSVYQQGSGKERLMMLFLRDIDERKRETQMMRFKAERDALTGLLNRPAAELMIKACLQETGKGISHAFLIIDIDDFKNINDTLGHVFGDKVLATIGHKLRQTFRAGDIIGRIGGDEFIVFVKGLNEEEMTERRVQEICEVIRGCSPGKGGNYEVTASVGIALYDKDATTYQDLYYKADIALYAAKDKGKARYCFYQQGMVMDRSRHGRTKIDSDEQAVQPVG